LSIAGVTDCPFRTIESPDEPAATTTTTTLLTLTLLTFNSHHPLAFFSMPASVPNLNGSTNPANVAYGGHRSFPSEAYPQYGGEKSVIYRSADGKVVAGTARESGTCTLTYPCDEFFIVTEGWCDVRIHGGESFRLNKGDCIYIPKGTTGSFVFSDNFWNTAVFVDSERITQF
jgi:uncharacterized cupin superfamily protein